MPAAPLGRRSIHRQTGGDGLRAAGPNSQGPLCLPKEIAGGRGGGVTQSYSLPGKELCLKLKQWQKDGEGNP